MIDYEKDQEANERAHKYRWLVWGFMPAVFTLAVIWICRNELVFFYYTRIF